MSIKTVNINKETPTKGVYKTSSIDKHLPRLAEAALEAAYRRALASGSKVLIAEAGELKEVSYDGTKRTLKKISSPVKMQKGMKIKIK